MREFEENDDVRVMLLLQRTSAAGLTLVRNPLSCTACTHPAAKALSIYLNSAAQCHWVGAWRSLRSRRWPTTQWSQCAAVAQPTLVRGHLLAACFRNRTPPSRALPKPALAPRRAELSSHE